MLFPDRGSTYLDDSHKTVLSKMETFYANSISMNQAFGVRQILIQSSKLEMEIYGTIYMEIFLLIEKRQI